MSFFRSMPVIPPTLKNRGDEVPLVNLPSIRIPDDHKFHGQPSITFYSYEKDYKRATYSVFQLLTKDLYITVTIRCIQEISTRTGAPESWVEYQVCTDRFGKTALAHQDSEYVYNIPDLLRALRYHDLPKCGISRDCLPPEVSMYQSPARSGDQTYRPLTDNGAVWWSFNRICTALDDIAAAEAAEAAAATAAAAEAAAAKAAAAEAAAAKAAAAEAAAAEVAAHTVALRSAIEAERTARHEARQAAEKEAKKARLEASILRLCDQLDGLK
jgi:hypothetical protein